MWPFRRVPEELDRPITRLDSYPKYKHLIKEVSYLVIVSSDYIVFIDKDGDIDWESSTFNSETEGKINAALNTVAALEATPCDDIPRKMKLQFKRLIGEGLARAFESDHDASRQIFKTAGEYIRARSQETSRYWYLSASSVAAAIFAMCSLPFWLLRGFFEAELGLTAFWLCLSAIAGAIGALLSVIGRTGKQHFDSSAGKRVHYIEASERIVAGAISGIVVGLAIRSGFILGNVVHNGNQSAIMMLAAVAAGTSERLATSIISKLESTNAHGTRGDGLPRKSSKEP